MCLISLFFHKCVDLTIMDIKMQGRGKKIIKVLCRCFSCRLSESPDVHYSILLPCLRALYRYVVWGVFMENKVLHLKHSSPGK